MKIKKNDIDILERIFLNGYYVGDQGAIDNNNECEETLLSSGTKRIFITTKSHLSDDYKYHLRFDYISNRDGSLRWIYPVDQPSRSLVFYNTSSTRGMLIDKAIRFSEHMSLSSLVANGTINIYLDKLPKYLESLSSDELNDITIFTGTKGERRNAVIFLDQSNAFVKIPIGRSAISGIIREREALDLLHELELKSFYVPEIINQDDDGYNMVTSVKRAGVFRTGKFSREHSTAIQQFTEKTARSTKICNTSFWDKICSNISLLSMNLGSHQGLIHQLNQLKTIMEERVNQSLIFSMAHGDFTPWNMYSDGESIYLYDWEYALFTAPLGYDVFHFIYQNRILSQPKSDSEIMLEIFEVMSSIDLFKNLSKEEVTIYHLLYFLFYVSSQLCDYIHQHEISEQNEKQLNQWKMTAARLLKTTSFSNYRLAFLNELDKEIMPLSYAFLKFNDQSLTSISEYSDVDIVIQNEDAKKVVRFCKNSDLVHKCRQIKKSFMTALEISFLDGTFLAIDLIHDFKRKHLLCMTAHEILSKRRMTKNGFLVPSAMHDMEYLLLFYGINGSDIPSKYRAHFKSRLGESLDNIITRLFEKYALDPDRVDFWKHTKLKKDLLKECVLSKTENRGSKGIKNVVNYLLDTLIDLTKRKGFMITFSGVDGAGKTTLINTIKDKIAKRFRRDVVLLRHRPHVLPILSALKHGVKKAEKVAGQEKPRQGENTGMISSAFRFMYYFMDYFFGQLYIYFRYIVRGNIVLYDRYYFDFINDARRSNIDINPWLTKRLYKFLMKPRWNYFLYAKPATILERKQETSKEDIIDITQKYKALFSEYEEKYQDSAYVSIENEVLPETVNTILSSIR